MPHNGGDGLRHHCTLPHAASLKRVGRRCARSGGRSGRGGEACALLLPGPIDLARTQRGTAGWCRAPRDRSWRLPPRGSTPRLRCPELENRPPAHHRRHRSITARASSAPPRTVVAATPTISWHPAARRLDHGLDDLELLHGVQVGELPGAAAASGRAPRPQSGDRRAGSERDA